MTTQIVSTYQDFVVGPTTATDLSDLLAAPPPELDSLTLQALLLVNDVSSVVAGVPQRVFTMKMDAQTPATATCLLGGGADGTGIESVTVTAAGGGAWGYAVPPIVTFAPQGSLYPAYARANMQLGGAIVLSGGSSYSAPVVTFSGGSLAPGGTQATATATVVAGAITAINITSAGGPYWWPPTITITDSAGSGAYILPFLNVASITVTSPGRGYGPTAPAVTITPLFKIVAPDSSGTSTQASAVRNWMTGILKQGTLSPIWARQPVVT